MKSQVVTAVAAIVLTASGFWLYQRAFTDRWQPTGDGKTIVNVRTGELRFASTGNAVQPHPVIDAEMWRELAIQNGQHFNAAQAMLMAMPAGHTAVSFFMPPDWMDCFENDEFPSEQTRDAILRGIGEGSRSRKIGFTQWEEIYDHLAALRYGCPPGAEPMIRTPDQERESRAIKLGIKKSN